MSKPSKGERTVTFNVPMKIVCSEMKPYGKGNFWCNQHKRIVSADDCFGCAHPSREVDVKEQEAEVKEHDILGH